MVCLNLAFVTYSGVSEGQSVPVPLATPIVLLLLNTDKHNPKNDTLKPFVFMFNITDLDNLGQKHTY